MEANNPFFPFSQRWKNLCPPCRSKLNTKITNAWCFASTLQQAKGEKFSYLLPWAVVVLWRFLIVFFQLEICWNCRPCKCVSLRFDLKTWNAVHDFFMGILMFDDGIGHQNLEFFSDCQILRQIMRYPFLRVKGGSCLCSRRCRKLRVEMEKENSEWRWTKLKSFGGHTGSS